MPLPVLGAVQGLAGPTCRHHIAFSRRIRGSLLVSPTAGAPGRGVLGLGLQRTSVQTRSWGDWASRSHLPSDVPMTQDDVCGSDGGTLMCLMQVTKDAVCPRGSQSTCYTGAGSRDGSAGRGQKSRPGGGGSTACPVHLQTRISDPPREWTGLGFQCPPQTTLPSQVYPGSLGGGSACGLWGIGSLYVPV